MFLVIDVLDAGLIVADGVSSRFLRSVWRVLLSATAGVPVEAYRPTHNLNHHASRLHSLHAGLVHVSDEEWADELSRLGHSQNHSLPQ